MKSRIRLYYAQPIDFVPTKKVIDSVERLQALIKNLPIDIVTPYLDEQMDNDQFLNIPLNRESARQIIEKDYAALDTCDVLLVDLSQEDRQAVGMIFEIAYAFSKGKTIIAFASGSSLGDRVWIVATVDYIFETWEEIRVRLSQICPEHGSSP